MSEELQNSDAAPEINAAPAENQATGSELAPDTDGQQEPQVQVDDAAAKEAKAKAATQKVIDKKHFEAEQAKRERDDALSKVAKFEQDKRDAEALQAGNIPPIPDEFDDDFAAKIAARDEAVSRKATFDANQKLFAQQQEQQVQQQAAQQAATDQQAQVQYNARAVELGINQAELLAAGTTVGTFGMSGDLVRHILSDNDGPLIVKHLAENTVEAMTLVNMSPYQQGAFLDQIKIKAAALKPIPTNVPDPPEILKGVAAISDDKKYPNSAGAKFS